MHSGGIVVCTVGTRCFVPDDKLSGVERDAGWVFHFGCLEKKCFTISQIKDHIFLGQCLKLEKKNSMGALYIDLFCEMLNI